MIESEHLVENVVEVRIILKEAFKKWNDLALGRDRILAVVNMVTDLRFYEIR